VLEGKEWKMRRHANRHVVQAFPPP
jgi:hypothetical protein